MGLKSTFYNCCNYYLSLSLFLPTSPLHCSFFLTFPPYLFLLFLFSSPTFSFLSHYLSFITLSLTLSLFQSLFSSLSFLSLSPSFSLPFPVSDNFDLFLDNDMYPFLFCHLSWVSFSLTHITFLLSFLLSFLLVKVTKTFTVLLVCGISSSSNRKISTV